MISKGFGNGTAVWEGMVGVLVNGEIDGAFLDRFVCECGYLFNFFWGCLFFDGVFVYDVEVGCAVIN